jgi:hypothetical protein
MSGRIHTNPDRSVALVGIALAAAVVAYLLSAVVLRDFVPAEAATTSLRFPEIAIAIPSVVAGYAAPWFYIKRQMGGA